MCWERWECGLQDDQSKNVNFSVGISRVSKFFKHISGRFVWRQKASSLPSRFSYWICYDQKAALKKHKIRTLLDLVGQPLVNSGDKGQVAAAWKINRWSMIWREFHQITQIYPIDLGLGLADLHQSRVSTCLKSQGKKCLIETIAILTFWVCEKCTTEVCKLNSLHGCSWKRSNTKIESRFIRHSNLYDNIWWILRFNWNFKLKLMVKSSVDLLTQKGVLFFGLFNKKSLKTKGDEIDEDMIMSSSRWKKNTIKLVSFYCRCYGPKIWGLEDLISWMNWVSSVSKGIWSIFLLRLQS